MKNIRNYILEEVDVEPLINYLQNDPDEEVVQELINTFNSAVLKSDNFQSYLSDSGLDSGAVYSMIHSLSSSDAKLFIGLLSNYDTKLKKFEPRKAGLIQNTLKEYLDELLDGESISSKGIQALISNKTTIGTISNGPGENILCLLYSNVRKAEKGDLDVDGYIVECKFGGGYISSTNCTGMRPVWVEVSSDLGVESVNWVKGRPQPSINEWWDKAYEKLSINQKFSDDDIAKKLSESMSQRIYNMFKSPSGYDTNQLATEIFKEIKNNISKLTSKDFLKIFGSLSCIAYKFSEGFDSILIESGNPKNTYNYTRWTLVTDFRFKSLMKSNLSFSGPNPDPSYAGGGLVVNVK